MPDAVRHPVHEQMVREPKFDRRPVAITERSVEVSDHTHGALLTRLPSSGHNFRKLLLVLTHRIGKIITIEEFSPPELTCM